MMQLVADCNLFEVCQTNCVMEISILGVALDYRKKGIAKQLCEASVEIANLLNNGLNVKMPINGIDLSLKPAPTAVYIVSTSWYTQKITESLHFTTGIKKRVEEFECLKEKVKIFKDDKTDYFVVYYKVL